MIRLISRTSLRLILILIVSNVVVSCGNVVVSCGNVVVSCGCLSIIYTLDLYSLCSQI